jgi:hypothetical protein
MVDLNNKVSKSMCTHFAVSVTLKTQKQGFITLIIKQKKSIEVFHSSY